MTAVDALEVALTRALATITGLGTPPRLRAAIRHAVLPGGARVRPRLVLATARACSGRHAPGASEAAVAIELVHCASLVHDDLPCFDNAAIRRGRASVHAKYGESLAVLVGDALIAGAFEIVGHALIQAPLLAPGIPMLARAIGAGSGLVAGQAWEGEPRAELTRYHRAKTGALFEAAVCLGALAGGGHPEAWRPLGDLLGLAYQLADDICDFTASPGQLGKPVGQDLLLGRPSAVTELGVEGACAELHRALDRLPELVPDVPGRDELRNFLTSNVKRLFAPVRAAASRPHLDEAASISA